MKESASVALVCKNRYYDAYPASPSKPAGGSLCGSEPVRDSRIDHRFGSLKMALPLAPILIAGVTAAVGYFFQENSAKNARLRQQADADLERERQLRHAELSRAQEIFAEISSAMDVLYYYMRHGGMYVAVRKAQGDESRADKDAETWKGYEDAVLQWMTHKSRFAAQMRRYFGEESHRLLQEIEEEFEDAGSLVAATYYNRKHSVVKDGKEDSGDFYAVVNPLEHRLTELSEKMIRDIQHQTVGRLRTE